MKKILPNFIIVGTPKGGTRSLINNLAEHPNVFTVGPQTFFFDRNFEKGIKYYSKFFNDWDGEKAIGEKTPSYLASRMAPKRIYDTIPDVKLIFLLRDPVKRSYSDWRMDYISGREFRSFEDTIKWEIEGAEKVVRFKNKTKYLDTGKYADHIERYLKYFPKDQMLFIISEIFRKNKVKTLKNVLSFLEVSPEIKISTPEEYNVGGFQKSKIVQLGLGLMNVLNLDNNPFSKDIYKRMKSYNLTGKRKPMQEETKNYLKRYYKPYNERLSRIINIDLKDLWIY
jgi:hypothetical protein